jgi:hypothetical protein
MPFALLTGFASAVVLVWSIFKYYEASNALIDSYPQEFREEPLWRIAFPIFVFAPLAPLHLQSDVLKSMAGGCFAMLGISITSFLLENAVFGWMMLTACAGVAASTIGYLKTYRANCRRKIAHNELDNS